MIEEIKLKRYDAAFFSTKLFFQIRDLRHNLLSNHKSDGQKSSFKLYNGYLKPNKYTRLNSINLINKITKM